MLNPTVGKLYNVERPCEWYGEILAFDDSLDSVEPSFKIKNSTLVVCLSAAVPRRVPRDDEVTYKILTENGLVGWIDGSLSGEGSLTLDWQLAQKEDSNG